LEPWREHDTLCGLRDRLQLAFDCWNLLDATDGSSRRSVYLPPGLKELDSSYRNRIENALPSGFFRDALRTYAAMVGTRRTRFGAGILALGTGGIPGR
jgi:hypothetical protein